MRKYILLYGGIAGIILAGMLAYIGATTEPNSSSDPGMEMLFGYLMFMLPMSLVFVGVRAYRQRELGGTITFGKAFLCGLYISLVASVFYVGSWEIYVRTFASDYMDQWTTCQIEMLQKDGLTGDSLAVKTAELRADAETYRTNMPYRMLWSFMELLPLSLLASLISALVLRRRRPKVEAPA